MFKSQPTDDKQSLIGAWCSHVTHTKFWGSNHIIGTAEPEVVKIGTHVGSINSSNKMTKGAWLSSCDCFYPRGASSARVIAIIACPYVCLSACVCVTRWYCIKTAKRRITQTTPRDSPGTLVFWRQNSLVDDPPSPKICAQSDPHPFQTAQFRPIFAHSASTVRASEKSSISANRKSTMRFPTSHRWTMYVTPKSPKGWHNTRFCYFLSKFQLLSKKVCCKASSCENF